MTVAFQAKIENNAISIPDIYQDYFANEMFVTVSFAEKKKKVTKEDFKPFIDTSGWKFNRDEANER